MPEHAFEIEQMRHQRVQVAGQAQFPPLDKGEQVVIAGRRIGGKQSAPDRGLAGDRERRRRRHDRASPYIGDPPIDDAQQYRLIAYIELP